MNLYPHLDNQLERNNKKFMGRVTLCENGYIEVWSEYLQTQLGSALKQDTTEKLRL